MPFSEIELNLIERTVCELCRRRCPPKFHNEVRLRYRVTRHEVLIDEARAGRKETSRWTEQGIAKLKYIRSAGEWRLFWRHGSGLWQSYEALPDSPDLAVLVAEIDRDPNGCFFG
jgi:hypothetical protein